MDNAFKAAVATGLEIREKRLAEEQAEREKAKAVEAKRVARAVKKHRPLVEAYLMGILPAKVERAVANGDRTLGVEISLRTYNKGDELTPLGVAINEIQGNGKGMIEEICKEMGFEHVRLESWTGMAPGRNLLMSWPSSWKEDESDAASP